MPHVKRGKEDDRERVIARYAAWLRQDFAAVVKAIRDEIAREIPAIAALVPENQATLASGVDLALAMFLDGGIERGVLSEGEQASMAAIGAAGADAGVPVDAITASISVATRVVRDWPTRRQLLDREAGESFRIFSERTTTFANAVISAVLTAYATQMRTGAPARVRARFWRGVLDNELTTKLDVGREAAAVGCDLGPGWALVVVGGDKPHRLEAQALTAFPAAVPFSVTVGGVSHSMMALPAPESSWKEAQDRLRELARTHGNAVVVIGPYGCALALKDDYQPLSHLLGRIPAVVPSGALVPAGDLAEAAVLATVPLPVASAFTRDVLGGVDRQSEPRATRWLRTIEALVRHGGSPKAAARELGVDVKTVRRRMTRMSHDAGLRFDDFDSLSRLRLATLLRILAPQEGTSGH